MPKIESIAVIILILAGKCSGEWEIPDELRITDRLFALSRVFSPLAGYGHSSTDARNRIVSVAQTLMDTNYQTSGSFVSACSFTYSSRRRCLLDVKLESVEETNSPFSLEDWRSKLKNHSESCFIDGHEQNCSSTTSGDLIVNAIIYNASHVSYELKRRNSSSQEQFYQLITRKTMDQQLTNFFPTHSATDFTMRASVADKIFVYGRDVCAKKKCFNEIKRLAANLHEICVFDRCTSITPDIAMDDNFFKVKLKLFDNNKELVDSQIAVSLRGSKVPGFLSLLIVEAKVNSNDDSLPRFYGRRGRFHCPSETACPLEIAFHIDDFERNYNTLLNAILFVVIYGLSRTPLPIVSYLFA